MAMKKNSKRVVIMTLGLRMRVTAFLPNDSEKTQFINEVAMKEVSRSSKDS